MELEIGELGTREKGGPLTTRMSTATNLSWHLEHDGSVSPSGQELVTGVSGGDQFLSGMASLSELLNRVGCKVNSTCGLHVHVDAADLGYLELRRILAGFMVFVPQLWGSLVAAGRRTNQYCPPPPISSLELSKLMNLTSVGEVRDWFHKFLYNVEPMDTYTPSEKRAVIAQLKQFKAKKYMNTARRMAINFHSWMMRGTVEFRLKEATLDPGDLMMWPLWCGWFVEILGGSTKGGIHSGLTDKEVMMWMHDPPTLQQLADDCMPKALAAWVKERLASPAPNAPIYGSGEAWPVDPIDHDEERDEDEDVRDDEEDS